MKKEIKRLKKEINKLNRRIGSGSLSVEGREYFVSRLIDAQQRYFGLANKYYKSKNNPIPIANEIGLNSMSTNQLECHIEKLNEKIRHSSQKQREKYVSRLIDAQQRYFAITDNYYISKNNPIPRSQKRGPLGQTQSLERRIDELNSEIEDPDVAKIFALLQERFSYITDLEFVPKYNGPVKTQSMPIKDEINELGKWITNMRHDIKSGLLTQKEEAESYYTIFLANQVYKKLSGENHPSLLGRTKGLIV